MSPTHSPPGPPAARNGRTFIAFASLLVLWVCVVLVAAADAAEGARMVIRLTARTSLVFFLLAFLAHALACQWPSQATHWLLQHRRAFGLLFAFSHGLHAVAIAAFAKLDPAGFAQQTNLGNFVTGGLGYVFIVLMAATSWDGAVRRLGPKRWKLLHTAGLWYLWISFMVTFGKRIPVSAAYALPVAILVLALVFRLAVNARRRPAPRPGPTA